MKKRPCFFEKKVYLLFENLKERNIYKCRANGKPFNNKITN